MHFHVFSVVVLCIGIASAWLLFWWLPQPQDLKIPTATHAHLNARVSIVIPARNEAENLPKLLTSIARGGVEIYEIIVVDDFSEDDSARVAESFGAKVLPAPPISANFDRKAWARAHGAAAAAGDFLVFLDTDVIIQPNGLLQLFRVYEETGGDRHALSIQPYHEVPTWSEQCSAFFNLFVVAGLAASSIPLLPHRSVGGFGPCLLVAKSTYEAVAGHANVYNQKLEKIHLCEFLESHGFMVIRMGGKEVVHSRTYPHGIRQLFRGWRKSFALSATMSNPVALMAIVLWVAGAWTAFIGFVGTLYIGTATTWTAGNWLLLTAWLGAYGNFALHTDFSLRQIGTFRGLVSIVYPLPLLFTIATLLATIYDQYVSRKTSWRRRVISVKKM